jgi:hypothetical protein
MRSMTRHSTRTTPQPSVAFFSEDAVLSGLHGKFKDRQAIKNFHSQQVFARWHASFNVARRRIEWRLSIFCQLQHQMIVHSFLRYPCIAGGVPRKFSRFAVQLDVVLKWRGQ